MPEHKWGLYLHKFPQHQGNRAEAWGCTTYWRVRDNAPMPAFPLPQHFCVTITLSARLRGANP